MGGFWKSLCNSRAGWEIREVNWARLGFWRGVCGIGGMICHEKYRALGLCGYLVLVFILGLEPAHSEGSGAYK